MSRPLPLEIKKRLQLHNQSHLLRFWDQLDEAGQQHLLAEISEIDFEQLSRLISSDDANRTSPAVCEAEIGPSDTAMGTLAPPKDLVRLPRSAADHEEWKVAKSTGEQLLAAGKVGALLVAGGQGTRLGSSDPKGMFPIGPATDRSLFQIFAETILALTRRWGKPIPYFIMTSHATDDATRAFFERHDFFGLDRTDVRFFRQGRMPAVDCNTGQILLEAPDSLALSPDGHGGMLTALAKAGLLEEMERRGIEVLYYHQVDNPTAILCDPSFLGWHVQSGSEMSTKVVRKVNAEEKMGVLVDRNGQTGIVEYSDLPSNLAEETEEDGSLRLWAGNTAIHAFNVSFLKRLVGQHVDGFALPFHRAQKKVPYVDESGRRVEPAAANAWKFERFIFDALGLTKTSLVVEADRGREFHPVKNATGADSPATARRALIDLYARWLKEAGLPVVADAPLELSPLVALDAEDLLLNSRRGQPSVRAEFRP